MTADRLLGMVPPMPEGQGHRRPRPTGGPPRGRGRLVGRRYRLLSPVGRGGMGMVWHAHDVLLDRDVAVKELILPFGLDSAGAQTAHRRMLREARSAARLSHPGIVTVHDVVEEDGRPWIVMELVRRLVPGAGHPAETARCPPCRPPRSASGCSTRCAHAHAAGILHRDVKPGNVLLTADRVVLTDFGIAAHRGRRHDHPDRRCSWARPPTSRRSGCRAAPITQAADLWSFGATLYAAVEGRPPYEGPDAVAVLGAVLTQEPTRPQRAGRAAAGDRGAAAQEPGRPDLRPRRSRRCWSGCCAATAPAAGPRRHADARCPPPRTPRPRGCCRRSTSPRGRCPRASSRRRPGRSACR